MNPDNCGAHITGKHSHLWRKSMFLEPKVPEVEVSHKQMNQFAQTTNTSWRFRNNRIRTNFSHLSNRHPLKREKSAVDDVLSQDKNQSESRKTMVKSLLVDKKALEKSAMLVEGMKKLKEMGLLSGKGLAQVKLPGVIKHHYVYNDYHAKSTNPGYSRNYQGKFYTK